MMIDTRESKIFVGPGGERLHQLVPRRRRVDVAARHLLEQILELFV
jgi:hypothetical protein